MKTIIILLILGLLLSGCGRNISCEGKTVNTFLDYYKDVECCQECHTLGMNYFRYSGGGFSAGRCFCIEKGNNRPIQIY